VGCCVGAKPVFTDWLRRVSQISWGPKRFIPDRSLEITVGQMERSAVRSLLGVPQFSSVYWGFDLFRTDTEQTE